MARATASVAIPRQHSTHGRDRPGGEDDATGPADGAGEIRLSTEVGNHHCDIEALKMLGTRPDGKIRVELRGARSAEPRDRPVEDPVVAEQTKLHRRTARQAVV